MASLTQCSSSPGVSGLLVMALLALAGGSALVLGQTQPATIPATKPADEAPYSRQKLSDLVHVSGEAKKAESATAAAHISGVKNYLWKESETHCVYVIERNDHIYGEYVSETRDQAGHILERTEYYLLNWQSRGKPQDDAGKDLPYTRKTEHFNWANGVCTGSTVEWQRDWRSKEDGTFVKSTPAVTFKMLRSTITLAVPAEFIAVAGAKYSLTIRRKPTDFERDFMHILSDGMIGTTAVLDGDMLSRGHAQLVNGKATMDVEWPADLPAIRLELIESTGNPPVYPLPQPDTSRIKASMNIKPSPEGDKLVFKPAGDTI